MLFAQKVQNEPSIDNVRSTEQPKIDISAAQLPKSNANSVFTLGAVDVMGTPSGRLKTNNILTSVDILGKNLIQNQNVNFAWELFGRVPGVQLTNFNQGNVSGEFSFRGFNGEGGINAIKLLIDGIPSNTHDGNMGFIDSVFPLNIESIEVVRGTNDPRYGLYNIAGNANITTTTGGNYATGRVSYGSFNTTDVQTSVGYESNGFSQNYFLGYRKSSGFRDHSDLNRLSLSGKWFYTPEDGNFRVGASIRHYQGNSEGPGYLTFAESRSRPTSSNAFNQSDKTNRITNQYSAHIDIDLLDNLFWSTKAYFNDFNDTRFVKFSAGATQQERVTRENHYGVISTLTYRPIIPVIHDFALEGGFDAQFQENRSLRYLTNQRVRQQQTRNQDFDFNVYGTYVQATINPIESLKIVPAYRMDVVDGHFTNKLTGVDSSINDYDFIHQPKIGLVYTPIDGYSLYGNWGRTFQVGVGASAFRVSRVNNLKPSLNHGWETGLKLNPVKWMEGRIAFWQQTASNEARRRLNDPSNDSENIGRTKRQGVDVQLNFYPTEKLNVWGTYTWQEAKILRAGAGSEGIEGNEIDHVPNHLASGGVEYKILPDILFSMWANYQNNYFLEQTNSTGRFGGFIVGNLGLSYQVTRLINLDFQIRNINDAYYEYVWFDGSQSLHSPAAGRAFYGAVAMNF